MNLDEFVDTLRELELIVIDAFRWPIALVVDRKILTDAFGNYDFTKYKLPITGETVPIKDGKPNEFRLEFSDLTEEP